MPVAPVVSVDVLVAAAALAAMLGLWLTGRRRRRTTEPALGELRVKLDAALHKIDHFAASQGRFVATLAEEIRAPLATALIHAEHLRAGSNEPTNVELHSARLLEDVRRLSGLVESYLRLAHPLAHEDTARHVPVHVHDVVLAAVKRCRFLADTRDVAIVPTLAAPLDGAPVEVLGDAVLLEAMLENLLRNGVLSSPRGTRVGLRVELVADQEVRVAVVDRGPPIDEAGAEEVFRGFFEVPAPSRAVSGAGLSLAIAMRVAEHHRGTISLVNVPEGGCRYEVHLPRWTGEGRSRTAT